MDVLFHRCEGGFLKGCRGGDQPRLFVNRAPQEVTRLWVAYLRHLIRYTGVFRKSRDLSLDLGGLSVGGPRDRIYQCSNHNPFCQLYWGAKSFVKPHPHLPQGISKSGGMGTGGNLVERILKKQLESESPCGRRLEGKISEPGCRDSTVGLVPYCLYNPPRRRWLHAVRTDPGPYRLSRWPSLPASGPFAPNVCQIQVFSVEKVHRMECFWEINMNGWLEKTFSSF